LHMLVCRFVVVRQQGGRPAGAAARDAAGELVRVRGCRPADIILVKAANAIGLSAVMTGSVSAGRRWSSLSAPGSTSPTTRPWAAHAIVMPILADLLESAVARADDQATARGLRPRRRFALVDPLPDVLRSPADPPLPDDRVVLRPTAYAGDRVSGPVPGLPDGGRGGRGRDPVDADTGGRSRRPAGPGTVVTYNRFQKLTGRATEIALLGTFARRRRKLPALRNNIEPLDLIHRRLERSSPRKPRRSARHNRRTRLLAGSRELRREIRVHDKNGSCDALTRYSRVPWRLAYDGTRDSPMR
jgi:hypothetical protein